MASARWCWRFATATTTSRPCSWRKAPTSTPAIVSSRTPLYMAVDMHSLDWIQNRPAPKAEEALDSLDMVEAAAGQGAKPDAQLTAVPPGWKGDAIAAQNTFGNVIGAGTTPFVRAAKNGDLPVLRLLIEQAPTRTSSTRNKTTALMALVGGLGRKYGADLKVSPAEEKNALAAARLCLTWAPT